MRVAFVSRATLYTSPGGDTTQLDMTARHLRELGVAVDVYLAPQAVDYAGYDLLHFFNVIRPADAIRHIKQSRKPYVVSTIFVEYGVVPGRGVAQTVLLKALGADGMEYAKAVARAVRNGERIVSADYLRMGHRAAVRYVAAGAAVLLPNSASEYRRLEARYGVRRPYRAVPNGIDAERAARRYPPSEAHRDAVLCMGRVEPRKNQLGLIRALNGTPYRLFVHGKPSPNAGAYHARCRAEAAGNVVVGDHLGGDALFAAYASARVHVLPSYFETTGLSSLEAAVMGCNVVVTPNGDTREYFGGDAHYCDPDRPASIRAAVDAAFAAPYDEGFRRRILRDYTWRRAAEETLAAYRAVLGA